MFSCLSVCLFTLLLPLPLSHSPYHMDSYPPHGDSPTTWTCSILFTWNPPSSNRYIHWQAGGWLQLKGFLLETRLAGVTCLLHQNDILIRLSNSNNHRVNHCESLNSLYFKSERAHIAEVKIRLNITPCIYINISSIAEAGVTV